MLHCLRQQACLQSQLPQWQGSSAIFHPHPCTNRIKGNAHWGLPHHAEGFARSHSCEDMQELWVLLMHHRITNLLSHPNVKCTLHCPRYATGKTRTAHQPLSVRQLMGVTGGSRTSWKACWVLKLCQTYATANVIHCSQQWNPSKIVQRWRKLQEVLRFVTLCTLRANQRDTTCRACSCAPSLTTNVPALCRQVRDIPGRICEGKVTVGFC